MKPRVALDLAVLGVSLLAASCTSSPWTLSDVQPGNAESHSWIVVQTTAARQDRKVTITGHTYDEIWAAAIQVAHEHFEILEQDSARGVIKAERTEIPPGRPAFWGFELRPLWESGGGAWVGIFIVPPATMADQYVVEVVGLPRHLLDPVQQDWTEKVLRDMQRVLAGEPIR